MNSEEWSIIISKNYYVPFLLSILITWLTLPYVNKLGKLYNILDIPKERKIHKNNLVRIGGVSIWFPFILSLLITYNINSLVLNHLIDNKEIYTIILASSLIFLLGLLDDIFNLSPYIRLVTQIIICTFVWKSGVSISSFDLSWLTTNFGEIYLPNEISYIITILFIVGLTNAINWLDGMDGLSAGATGICICGNILIALSYENHLNILLSITLLGTCIGFLTKNSKPADILMGDCGSNFLGFITALLVINNINRSSEISFFPQGLMIICFPLIDMSYVIIKRICMKKSPFFPDRNHIHHRLQKKGFSYNNTINIIYILNTATVIFGLYISKANLGFSLVFISVYLTIISSISSLRNYKNN